MKTNYFIIILQNLKFVKKFFVNSANFVFCGRLVAVLSGCGAQKLSGMVLDLFVDI